MKLQRSPSRSLRPLAPRCRNGVSSLLRLSQPSAPRFPQPQDLSGWVSRAAGAIGLTKASAEPVFAASRFGAGPIQMF
jgi:hypothetical protein